MRIREEKESLAPSSENIDENLGRPPATDALNHAVMLPPNFFEGNLQRVGWLGGSLICRCHCKAPREERDPECEEEGFDGVEDRDLFEHSFDQLGDRD